MEFSHHGKMEYDISEMENLGAKFCDNTKWLLQKKLAMISPRLQNNPTDNATCMSVGCKYKESSHNIHSGRQLHPHLTLAHTQTTLSTQC